MNAHARFDGTPPARPAAPGGAGSHDEIFIPRPILWMMVALAAFTILSVGVARTARIGLTREGAAPLRAHVVFRTGAVAEGAIVATLADGRRVRLAGAHEDIFPRMILQGITTIRHDTGVPADAPLAIDVAGDGQRLVVDTATRHVIRLAAFGPENGRSFDALLARPPA